jgi:hypothetical protein
MDDDGIEKFNTLKHDMGARLSKACKELQESLLKTKAEIDSCICLTCLDMAARELAFPGKLRYFPIWPSSELKLLHALVIMNPFPRNISADPGLRQGRGGAWDHRRCGTCLS